MTRARKLTLSVKEFSHLVSESLDMAHASSTFPVPQSLVDNTALVHPSEQPQKSNPFQRIFSRPTPTPGQHDDSLQGPSSSPEVLFETPRSCKMIGWPFSRSPRKNRATPKEEEDAMGVEDPGVQHSPSTSVTSLAAASTSSLGSLLPAHERLFQVSSRDEEDPSTEDRHVIRVGASSPVTIAAPSCVHGRLTHSGCYIAGTTTTTSLDASATASDATERDSADSSRRSVLGASFEGTETSHSGACSEPESFDEDPTPRALTFGPRVLASADDIRPRDGPSHVQRGRQRLSLVVPPRNLDGILSLRPAVGVTPHAPSETGSSVSLLSTSSPTSPVAGGSTTGPSGSGTCFPRVPPPSTPPNPRVSVVITGRVPSTNMESGPHAFGYSPRRRPRAMSRSLTPPPLPRPPPTGPLPAVPSSPIPPVPPLPPLLSKMNASAHALPRSTGLPTTPASALPPSPLGGLRLPSRLSWVNSVRAVLPSPPASPTKTLKSLTGSGGQTPPVPVVPVPGSPSNADKRRSGGGGGGQLKRPTSIGVIEAADNFQVRRTKSILLLGSKSKSNVSLGPKRVQIHADVDANPNGHGHGNGNGDDTGSGSVRKARRRSSAAVFGHPTFSDASPVLITPMPSSELLVPRERRHSAPILSSASDPKAVSADWTLSLPFCTDVPGDTMLLSPLSTPKLTSEQDLEEGVEGEGVDWTLCMPLKVRVDTPNVESVGGPESECTHADGEEAAGTAAVAATVMRGIVQLPTPSPSPRLYASSVVACPAPDTEEEDEDEGEEEEEEEEESRESVSEERPATPASLGPHVGGLDLAGGRGKRASGWHVYGWFDDVDLLPEEEDEDLEDDNMPVAPPTSPSSIPDKFLKNHVSVFRKTHDAGGRSQDSMSTVSTSDTTFYSARSSLLVN